MHRVLPFLTGLDRCSNLLSMANDHSPHPSPHEAKTGGFTNQEPPSGSDDPECRSTRPSLAIPPPSDTDLINGSVRSEASFHNLPTLGAGADDLITIDDFSYGAEYDFSSINPSDLKTELNNLLACLPPRSRGSLHGYAVNGPSVAYAHCSAGQSVSGHSVTQSQLRTGAAAAGPATTFSYNTSQTAAATVLSPSASTQINGAHVSSTVTFII